MNPGEELDERLHEMRVSMRIGYVALVVMIVAAVVETRLGYWWWSIPLAAVVIGNIAAMRKLHRAIEELQARREKLKAFD